MSTDIATVGLFPENAKPYAERVDLAIDHHPSFESFGRENIVRPEAAACGELVYDILAQLGPITAEMALPLYVAVSTDTGCFAYANTTAQTHAVAAALLRTGIDYQTVNKVFFRTKSRKRMQLEAAILNDCEFYDRDRVAVLSVPLSLMERLQATETDAEDLSALGAPDRGGGLRRHHAGAAAGRVEDVPADRRAGQRHGGLPPAGRRRPRRGRRLHGGGLGSQSAIQAVAQGCRAGGPCRRISSRQSAGTGLRPQVARGPLHAGRRQARCGPCVPRPCGTGPRRPLSLRLALLPRRDRC